MVRSVHFIFEYARFIYTITALSIFAPVAAEAFEIKSILSCGPLTSDGHTIRGPFDGPVDFSFVDRKFKAVRYPQRRSGKENYWGDIDAHGNIQIAGDGAYDDGPPHDWRYHFVGRASKSRRFALSGEMVSQHGSRRDCSLAFLDAGDRILEEAAVQSPSTPTVTNPPPAPLPVIVPTQTPSAGGEKARQPQKAIPPINVSVKYDPMTIVIGVVTSENAALANERIADLKAEIDLFTMIRDEQLELEHSLTDDAKASIGSAVAAIDTRLDALRNAYASAQKPFQAYLTSIKPNDRDLYISAKKASEVYPKIPYYIPGTSETGEFWIEPSVSDNGELRFAVKFIDNASSLDRVRETIDISLQQMEATQQALLKLHDWSKIAHEQAIRRNYEKRVICFPVSDCPPDGETVDEKGSTEIRFNVYEDGSTAGRIQRNKGRFVEGFNFSIDSAMLLQAYLGHVIKTATSEYNSGTQNKSSLDNLFN
jgi:hypothetical protein